MLLVTLCAAMATWGGSLRVQEERLYGAPSIFWDHLPIAEFTLQGPQGANRVVKLLIDSGSNRSVLFPSSGPLTSGAVLAAGGVALGSCEFKQVGRREMTADGARLMSRLGVAGALGDDFLIDHDVLIDYRRGRIFVSKGQADDPVRLILSWPSEALSTLSLKRLPIRTVDLVQQDDRFFAPATVGNQTACLLALDTGTGESALPIEIAEGLKKTGVVRLVAGFQGKTIRAAEHLAKIAVGDNPPIEIRVLGYDQRGPILGGNAFGGQRLFLRLGTSRASYW